MKVTMFASGSTGNSALVQMSGYNILIDCGIPKKNIEENLNKNNLTLSDINFLLITHEHMDHIKSFNSLLKYEDIKILISKGTYNSILETNKHKNIKSFEIMNKRVLTGSIIILNRLEKSIMYHSYQLDNLVIDILPTFHDASESIGFVIRNEEQKMVYITDTGYVHKELFSKINNADLYVLESNHDPVILMHSQRPYPLKMRILSNHGHLSNQDSMVVLAHIIGDKTKVVIHAHISLECNLSQIVEMTRKKVFDEYGIDTSGIEFEIAPAGRGKVHEL